MKKIALIIVTIALVAIMAVTFVACSTATVQGQLKDVWRPYEKYVYTVDDDSKTTNGTYTVEVIHNNEPNVTIGTVTLEGVGKGIIVNGTLTYDNTVYTTACYVQLSSGGSFLVPKASYRKQVVDGVVTLELGGKYDGANYTYFGTENGNNVEGSIGLKSPYYDNNEFHQLLRGVSSMSTGFSFSFNVPAVVGEANLASLTASVVGSENIIYADNSYECFKVSLSRSTKVQGKAHTLFYTVNPVDVNGWKLPYVLVKFVEPTATGEVTYTLNSISLEK